MPLEAHGRDDAGARAGAGWWHLHTAGSQSSKNHKAVRGARTRTPQAANTHNKGLGYTGKIGPIFYSHLPFTVARQRFDETQLPFMETKVSLDER